MLFTLLFLIFIVASYFIGSLCSAILISRMFALPDPRTEGSKNPGATNVLRLSGKKYAFIVLLADMFKGFLPVLLLKILGFGPNVLGFACFAAVFGHMYPFFFGFKGGKGVATALGGILAINFIFGVEVIATWLLIANFTRYASLASICALMLAPLYVLFTPNGLGAFIPLIFVAAFIVYKHRDNITRLIDGEERKIQFNRSSLANEVEATLIEQEKEEEFEEAVQHSTQDLETQDVVKKDLEDLTNHKTAEEVVVKTTRKTPIKKIPVEKPKPIKVKPEIANVDKPTIAKTTKLKSNKPKSVPDQ